MAIKKSFIIIPAVVLATVFLSGCGSKSSETGKTQEGSSIVGSLKEAVGLGKKMTCTSKDASGDTTAYIDGKKYKSVTATSEGTMVAIFTGEDFYGWNEKTKEGFKMTKACTDELSKDVPESAEEAAEAEDDFITTEDIVEEGGFDNDNCKETTEKVDFNIPSDVKFIDQCEFIKTLQAEMPALEVSGQE